MNSRKLNFRWRTWYWNFAPIASAFMISSLAIFMILIADLNDSFFGGLLYPLYIAFTSLISFSLAVAYLWLANKDYLFQKNKLKPHRIKFLKNGSIFFLISQSVYMIGLIINFIVVKNYYEFNGSTIGFSFPGNISAVGYLGFFMASVCLLNLGMMIYWTFFQFTFGFDIFQYDNRDYIEELVKAESKNNKIKNYNHSWNEIAEKNKNSNIKFQNPKWSYFVNDYLNSKKENEENESNKS
ncbi:hypothetical protein J2Z62_000176 [Mycoplasmoides fastidiosum]|uniref:Uncharacterized protein n=1 Tax=Mycoplasmoides fastidiosum TaxID=92758 RepID=A0ABU0LYH3_9BACT|nr:hypothetical protein [Mycoplasmoides fastidiosum]MDQ0513738.1 hypothetical protein [Mycoplasmoides fastidiosum]UUD37841.1 hypothetical protein NPA10_00380 [Mycoplasmoides fastidiosum]